MIASLILVVGSIAYSNKTTSVNTSGFGGDVWSTRSHWNTGERIDIIAYMLPDARLAFPGLAEALERYGLQVERVNGPIVLSSNDLGKPMIIVLTSKDARLYNLTSRISGLLSEGYIIITDYMSYERISGYISDYGAIVEVDVEERDEYIVVLRRLNASGAQLYTHVVAVSSLETDEVAGRLIAGIMRGGIHPASSLECYTLHSIVAVTRASYPYGILDIEHQVYKYTCESIPDSDVFRIMAVTTIVPGRILNWSSNDGGMWWSDRLINTYKILSGANMYDAMPYYDINKPPLNMMYTTSLYQGYRMEIDYWSQGIVGIDWQGSIGLNIARWVHELGSGYWSGYPHGTPIIVTVNPSYVINTINNSNAVMEWNVTGLWSRPGYRGAPAEPHSSSIILRVTISPDE